MSKDIGKLAVEVYGPDTGLQVIELSEGIVQVVLVHPAGMPLAMVTARSEEQGKSALSAALSIVLGK